MPSVRAEPPSVSTVGPPLPFVAPARRGPRPRNLVLAAIGFGALLALPFFASGYIVRFLTEVFMLLVMAEAWNIIGGLSGYVSFGHVVFFGLGGYTTGLLMTKMQLPFPVALAGAAALAVVFAILVGLPILRLRGHYFAIATYGIAEAMKQIVISASDFTGGGMGLNVPPLRLPEVVTSLLGGPIPAASSSFYYLMLALLALTVWTTWYVLRERLGYGLRAIRADEQAAAVLGVDRTRYKVTAFAISALFPTLAGGIYAVWFTYIDAPTVFSVDYSITMVIMTLLGGIGTVWGPIVGGAVLWIVGEAIWGQFLELHSAFLGLVLIFVVIFLPRGILDAVRRGPRALSPGAIRRSIRQYSV